MCESKDCAWILLEAVAGPRKEEGSYGSTDCNLSVVAKKRCPGHANRISSRQGSFVYIIVFFSGGAPNIRCFLLSVC